MMDIFDEIQTEEDYKKMKKENPSSYAKYCRQRAFHFEDLDEEECLFFIGEAYQLLDIVENREEHFRIRCCYYVYAHLFQNNDYLYELLLLKKELSSFSKNKKLIFFCKIRILQSILETYEYEDIQEYLQDASAYYELVHDAWESYPELFSCRFSPLNACSFLFIAYHQLNQRILSIYYLKEALEWCEIFDETGQDEFRILSILANLYQLHGFIEEARPLSRKLFAKVASQKLPEGLTQGDIHYGVLPYISVLNQENHRVYASKLLQKLFDKGYIYDNGEDISYGILLQNAAHFQLGLSDTQNQQILSILKQITIYEKSPVFEKYARLERLEFYTTKALLLWRIGDTSLYHKIKKELPNLIKEIPLYQKEPMIQILGVLTAMSLESYDYVSAFQFTQEIIKISNELLSVSLTLQRTDYLSDFARRFSKNKYIIYSMYRGMKSVTESYKIVLNWKNIVSLMTAFKNIAAEELNISQTLIEELNRCFNEKADRQLYTMFRGEENSQEIDEKISRLEAELAQLFQGEVKYINFDTEDLMQMLPDNSIFLEYFIYYKDYYKSYLYPSYFEPENQDKQECIDLFCFRKVDGICTVHRYTINDDSKLENAAKTVAKELKRSRHKKLNRYLEFLYERLIGPAQKELKGISNLYISSDSGMNIIPFELLLNKEGQELGFLHTITFVDTGRDFIRRNKKHFYKNFLIVGAPAYDYKISSAEQAQNRSFNREEVIYSLPLSELESNMIADEYGIEPYTGIKANKTIIEKMKDARWIHLATHGAHDISENKEDSWYSCALFLAGAENWRKDGSMHPLYGTGILTADEIRRMDLSGTEMVVLSACYTGSSLGSIDMASIRSAFRDAGVKYVISTLWGIDEIPSALFMRKFYQNLKIYEIPTSLRLTKEYLKNLTAKAALHTLKRALKEFELENYKSIRNSIQEMEREHHPDQEYIYRDPYYWSSFVCHQNLFKE